MGVLDNIRQRIAKWLTPGEFADPARRQMAIDNELRREYYAGNHRQQIKVKAGQANDNLAKNYVRLVVDRSVSMAIGGGVSWDTPGEGDDDPAQAYLDQAWRANGGATLLHSAAQYAAIYGTGYLKVMPGEIQQDGRDLPRIIALDPRWLRITTAQEDPDTVTEYESRFSILVDGKERNRREVVTRAGITSDGDAAIMDQWIVREYIDDGAGRWIQTDETDWPHAIGPITHWQNLPAGGTPYGESEIDGIIPLQDRINFTTSNISKILRYHAHPRTWSRGQLLDEAQSWGPDEIYSFISEDATVQNLEMQSDLAAALNYLSHLRQTLFDVSRTVDMSSIPDRLGSITNFGIRVLYADALAKLETKRRLMGDGLTQVNRLLLELAGLDPDPGIVVWPDMLPKNPVEELQAAQLTIDLGIASKQTLSAGMGYDWEQEQERITEEAAASDNVGGALLRAFGQGQI